MKTAIKDKMTRNHSQEFEIEVIQRLSKVETSHEALTESVKKLPLQIEIATRLAIQEEMKRMPCETHLERMEEIEKEAIQVAAEKKGERKVIAVIAAIIGGALSAIVSGIWALVTSKHQ